LQAVEPMFPLLNWPMAATRDHISKAGRVRPVQKKLFIDGVSEPREGKNSRGETRLSTLAYILAQTPGSECRLRAAD
jgi:hypothetical protein